MFSREHNSSQYALYPSDMDSLNNYQYSLVRTQIYSAEIKSLWRQNIIDRLSFNDLSKKFSTNLNVLYAVSFQLFVYTDIKQRIVTKNTIFYIIKVIYLTQNLENQNTIILTNIITDVNGYKYKCTELIEIDRY